MGVGSPIIYRPPLWSQEAEYSAADDRRLILSSLDGGVIDLDDLRVIERQEGANLSVDVLPGHAVVPGTEQVDQGHYLCPLAQRVNIPVAAGPAAGSTRTDVIIARVYEPIGQEAYWQVEAVTGVPNQEWQWQGGPLTSFTPLATIAPITSQTVAITQNLITDQRHRSRPASTGTSRMATQTLPTTWLPGSWTRWGQLLQMTHPPNDQPVDIEVRVQGVLRATADGLGTAYLRIRFSATGQAWTHELGDVAISSTGTGDYRPFSITLPVVNVAGNWPQVFQAEVVIVQGSGQITEFPPGAPCSLTMRVSPSGSALL